MHDDDTPDAPERTSAKPHQIRRVSLGRHFEMHPVVFPAGAAIVLSFVIVTLALIADGVEVDTLYSGARDWIGRYFGWFYVVALTGILLLAIWIACSRYGRIRLGRDDEKPEFNRLTWSAMLFSAGMGVGLMFWGVAEPAYHIQSVRSGSLPVHATPFGDVGRSLGTTVFHWGLHPWALYAIVGLALGYFGFRRGMPLSFRSILHPLLGDAVWGKLGDAIDILAIVATLCGVSASLGMGATQVNAGLAFLFGVPVSKTVQVLLIIGITLIATVSVVLGLGRGIRRLSEANMVLAGILLIVVIVTGGVVGFLLSTAQAGVGYASVLPFMSVRLFGTDAERQEWVTGWTVLYWAWWIAWSPFVGMFIARISRGRTVREFILAVMIVPTLFTILWFAAFGGAALDQHNDREQTRASLPVYDVILTDDEGGLLRDEDDRLLTEPRALTSIEYLNSPIATEDREEQIQSLPTVLFALFEGLMPAGVLLSAIAGIATLCVVLFFVTSSDSASMVIDIIASGGNPDPPVGTRLFWAIAEGLVAAGILIAGGTGALQSASITAALPFTVIVILACVALVLALRRYER